MRTPTMTFNRITALGATITALAMPAAAVATKPAENPGKGHDKTTQTAPKGKAYGKYCKTESKEHVKGEKGTAHSRCVKAAAQAAKTADEDTTVSAKKAAKTACKTFSKKHVKGEKGTAYSRCIVAAAHANKDAKADDDSDSTETETETQS